MRSIIFMFIKYKQIIDIKTHFGVQPMLCNRALSLDISNSSVAVCFGNYYYL